LVVGVLCFLFFLFLPDGRWISDDARTRLAVNVLLLIYRMELGRGVGGAFFWWTVGRVCASFLFGYEGASAHVVGWRDSGTGYFSHMPNRILILEQHSTPRRKASVAVVVWRRAGKTRLGDLAKVFSLDA
jgi:hypothetical protein